MPSKLLSLKISEDDSEYIQNWTGIFDLRGRCSIDFSALPLSYIFQYCCLTGTWTPTCRTKICRATITPWDNLIALWKFSSNLLNLHYLEKNFTKKFSNTFLKVAINTPRNSFTGEVSPPSSYLFESTKNHHCALPQGLEPWTPWLTVRCSNQLS